MTPTPSTTSSSLSAHSPEGPFRVVRKRNRVPVSCAPCRSRKLKCNRGMPCENCVKRNDAPSCTYAQPKFRKKTVGIQELPATPDGMQSRIDRLESLVLTLMSNGVQSVGQAVAQTQAAFSGGSTSSASRQDTQELALRDEMYDEEESDTEQVTKSFGVMKIDSKTQKSYYVSEAHWTMVLNDISEVKQYFITHKQQYEEHVEKIQATNNEQQHFAFTPLLFGAMKTPSEKEVLSNFPSKYTTDIILDRYFNHHEPFTHIHHFPSFDREYKRHWEDPSKSSIVWIAMVYAMLRLACLTYHDESEVPPEFQGKTLQMASTYRESMAQCLTLADYTKPHRYLIETLVLYLHADYAQVESEMSVWVLIGVIARLAMQMGYHRDPKMFPNISPFQGEMRRRVWAFIRQADLLLSFQVGLPSMIRTGDCDTELPRNLYDTDFDEDTVKLMPERPIDEATQISFLIIKAKLALAFGRVLETTQKVTGSSYEVVMDVDHQLRQTRDSIPERMSFKPIVECDESLNVVRSRFMIVSIYHRAQCVLHRRFLHRGRENPRYTYSRRTCIESAMELLRFQNILQAAFKTNPSIKANMGYMAASSTQDFLMSSTILALDIYQLVQENSSGRSPTDTFVLGVDRYQEELSMLRRSRDMWNELKDQSADAWRAIAIIDVLLGKLFPDQSQQDQDGSDEGAPAEPPAAPTPEGPFEPQDEKQNAAMTLGLLSTGLNQMGSTVPPQFGDTDHMKLESSGFGRGINQGGIIDSMQLPTPGGIGLGTGTFGQMPTMQPFNLDWDAWDNYIQTTATDPNNQNWPMFDIHGFSTGPLQPSPTPPPPPTLSQQSQRAHQNQPHSSQQQTQEQQTCSETTGGKRVYSMQQNVFDSASGG
ncbi:C6 transcription factor [Histoplasma capsulatum var. duboisii H88]|uniref:C6 transcription factor n=1 Tax=Ajellomyces capsulatus (strain H88) TaxID=544711 RepID=A0A8A1LQ31_AJEC8|nr:C6 transcription factor [Histoplasma capsulatum var. duboisii H88]